MYIYTCIIAASQRVPAGINNHMCISYRGTWPIMPHYIWHHVLAAKPAKPQRHTPNAAAFVFDRLSIANSSSALYWFSSGSCAPTFPHLQLPWLSVSRLERMVSLPVLTPGSRNQSGPCPWRVSVLSTLKMLSVLLNRILTSNTEFLSQLEGYENVRAYCYNCKFWRQWSMDHVTESPLLGQHWNGYCITRW